MSRLLTSDAEGQAQEAEYPVLLVKVFQGIIDCAEIHPTLDSAWDSLRQFIQAPADFTYDEYDEFRSTDDAPPWYSEDSYGDCRVLDVEPKGRAALHLSCVITFD